MDVKAVGTEDIGTEGRACGLTDWRQLCHIADEEHTAVATAVDIAYKVVEETAAAKGTLVAHI